MRISDWSSDVCSSDLVVADVHARASDEQSHKACEALVIDARRRGIPGLVPDLAVASNRHVQGERPDGDAIFFNDKLHVGAGASFGDEGGGDRKSTRLNSSH